MACLQLLEGAQARVGVVRRVALVLAAVVPADQLDGFDAVAGAFLADLGQVDEAQAQLILGRVDVDLLPGVRLARPGGDGGRLHPGVAPALVDVDARPASRPGRPRARSGSGRASRRAGCRARARRRSGSPHPCRRWSCSPGTRASIELSVAGAQLAVPGHQLGARCVTRRRTAPACARASRMYGDIGAPAPWCEALDWVG